MTSSEMNTKRESTEKKHRRIREETQVIRLQTEKKEIIYAT